MKPWNSWNSLGDDDEDMSKLSWTERLERLERFRRYIIKGLLFVGCTVGGALCIKVMDLIWELIK